MLQSVMKTAPGIFHILWGQLPLVSFSCSVILAARILQGKIHKLWRLGSCKKKKTLSKISYCTVFPVLWVMWMSTHFIFNNSDLFIFYIFFKNLNPLLFSISITLVLYLAEGYKTVDRHIQFYLIIQGSRMRRCESAHSTCRCLIMTASAGTTL